MMTKNFENFPVYIKSLDLIEKFINSFKNKSFEKEFEFNNQIKERAFQYQIILQKAQSIITTDSLLSI
jgi:hypothetical protein